MIHKLKDIDPDGTIYMREWRNKNRLKWRAYKKQWQRKNRLRISEYKKIYDKKYYQKNRLKIINKEQNYRLNYPMKYIAHQMSTSIRKEAICPRLIPKWLKENFETKC